MPTGSWGASGTAGAEDLRELIARDYDDLTSDNVVLTSGASEALAAFAQAMGLVYMKVPVEGGDYTMDHSATMVVLDPQGRQAGLIGPPLAWKDIAADLSRLASEPK